MTPLLGIIIFTGVMLSIWLEAYFFGKPKPQWQNNNLKGE